MRAKGRAADKSDQSRKEKKKDKKKKQKREVPADPSLHREDVESQQLSSSNLESESDLSPLGVLLADPCRPKDDPDLATTREIESLLVFQLFRHYLKDFEGGSRSANVAKDHTRRVCRLLFEVQDPATNPSVLWDNKNLNLLRNNFFRGNDLLGKTKRQPQTLKTYIMSLKLFY